MKHLWLLLALVLSASPLLHANDAWQDVYTVRQPSGNLYLPVSWNAKEGLLLNLRDANGQQHVRVYLRPQRLVAATAPSHAPLTDERGWLSKTLNNLRGGDIRKDESPVASAVYHRGGLPNRDHDSLPLTLKVRPGQWVIYLNDYPVARLPEPFAPPFTLSVQQSRTIAGEAARWQKVLPYAFSADFMIPELEEAPPATDKELTAEEEEAARLARLQPWQPQSGEWDIHSALEDAIDQETSTILEKRPLEAERSANFYCLTGSGRDAILTSGYHFLDNYELEASMRLDPGEMALVFYYQSPRDYYEMTLTVPQTHTNRVIVQLRRHSSTRLPRQKLLAAVEAELTPGQWIMPRIQVRDDRIIGFVDNTRIFNVEEPLPAGGAFGLGVNSDFPLRFDDVAVRTLSPLQLHTAAHLRYHTSAILGDFNNHNKRWSDTPAEGPTIVPPMSRQDKALIVGSRQMEPHVVSADFTAASRIGSYGLIAGFSSTRAPYYRFTRSIDANGESFRLERVEGKKAELLEEHQIPAGTRQPATAATLMLDPTMPGQLRLYRNGELALVHLVDEAPSGGIGVYVGPDTRTRISGFTATLTRPNLYRSTEEKNSIYSTDPYMRNWSSREGEWINDADGYLWQKSDFLGRFELHLPYQSGTEVHLGVPEGEKQGDVFLTVRDHNLSLYRSGDDTTPLATAKLPAMWPQISTQIEKKANDTIAEGKDDYLRAAFTIHYEDSWLWITDDAGDQLAKVNLGAPLTGRRMRLADYTFDHLMYSHTVNYNQMDYLFNKAPYDWIVNGGRWQVINRFQCDPRWSHFNGENADGMAALWAKYTFTGDFCLEAYLGVRHGSWYQNANDLNLTAMNQSTSVGDGYTAVATSWDANESQLWNRLYRNGETLAQNTTTTVPRRREGLKREFRHPLVGAGRDVHGAWYALKLRRIGDTLEYYFDNQLIFSTKDKAPLESGSIGLWTFNNSMMVARVRMSAESIAPRPITFRALPLNERTWQTTPDNPVDAPIFTALENHGQLVNQTVPAAWTLDDTVGMSTLTWHLENRRSPYFVFNNALGGGPMHVGQRHYTKASEISGWQFKLKRTAGARFNFHYSIGYLKPISGDGESLRHVYTPLRRYYHHISADADSPEPGYHQFGSTQVPGQPRGEGWHEQGAWSNVSVWLPQHDLAALTIPTPKAETVADGNKDLLEAAAALIEEEGWPKDLYVRVEGFGILIPSPLLNGLQGNSPGDGYAVKDFTPVHTQPPRLAGRQDDPLWRSLILLDSEKRQTFAEAPAPEGLQAWLDQQNFEGLHAVQLRAIGPGRLDHEVPLRWINLPAEPALACVWDDQRPYTLRLQAEAGYPDPRFYQATLTINGQAVPLITRAYGVRTALLPRSIQLESPDKPLSVVISSGGWSFSKAMHLRDHASASEGAPRHEPPVLLSVEGPFPLLETFESRQLPTLSGSATKSLGYYDPRQGTYLRTQNTSINHRLQTIFSTSVSVATHPLMQFRYRASEQSNISLRYGNFFYIDLGEPSYAQAYGGKSYSPQSVRYGTPLSQEPTWNTWLGMLSDVSVTEPLSMNLLSPTSISFASFHGHDQTGRLSTLDFDDIVIGPAVHKGEQLTITPTYFSFDTVTRLNIGLMQGATPWAQRSSETRNDKDVTWHEAANGEPFTPDLSGLQPGVHHLLLTAVDSRGKRATITDLPFLYDPRPPTTASAFATWKHPLGNGTALELSFSSDDLSPLDLQGLTFTSADAPVKADVHIAEIEHGRANQLLRLDYPYMFRERLDAMNNGETLTLKVDGIRDGAGNAAPPMDIPITIDHASDKQGPAWLPAKYPKSVNFVTDWHGRTNQPIHVEPARGNGTKIVHTFGEEPYLRTSTHHANGSITLQPRHWDLALHTNLAMRLRIPKHHDDTVLTISIFFKNDRRLLIRAMPERDGGRLVDPPFPLNLESEEWGSLDVDLFATAKKQWGMKEAQTLLVEKVVIARSKAKHNEALDLQNLTIYSPWQAEDVLHLDAYDASGIKDFVYVYEDGTGQELARGHFNERNLTIASLPIKRIDGGWLVIRARDKAENLSVPLRVPCAAPPLVKPSEEAALLQK